MPDDWEERALAKAHKQYRDRMQSLVRQGEEQGMGVLQFWSGKQWQAILSTMVPAGTIRSEVRSSGRGV